MGSIGLILGPNTKLSIGALAFVVVPEGNVLVLDGPISVWSFHGAFELLWVGVVDQR